MTPEEIAQRLVEGLPVDLSKVRVYSRVTLKKFEGDDQEKEPIETIILEDEGFKKASGLGDQNAATD